MLQVCNISNKKPRYHSDLKPIMRFKFNDLIILDFRGPLPMQKNGYKYILVMVDAFTGYVSLCPTRTNKHQDIITTLLARWIAIFGQPKAIIADNGDGFKSHIFAQFLKNLNIRRHPSNPYRSQTQGKVERIMRDLNQSLRVFSVTNAHNYVELNKIDKINNWEISAILFQLKHNGTIHLSTGFRPFELVFGTYNNNTFEQLIQLTDIEKYELRNSKDTIHYLRLLRDIQNYKNIIAKHKYIKTRENMLKQFHKQCRTLDYELKEGTLVMLSNKKRFEHTSYDKIGLVNKPGFIVIKILSHKRAIIRNQQNGEIKVGIHIDRLIPYYSDLIINHELSDIIDELEYSEKQLKEYALSELIELNEIDNHRIQIEEFEAAESILNDDDYDPEYYNEKEESEQIIKQLKSNNDDNNQYYFDLMNLPNIFNN